MTGRQGFAVWAIACLLAVSAGCVHRKGYIIGADIKLEFNRIPWRTGPDGRYEEDCAPCLADHGGCHGGQAPGPYPHGAAEREGCPPAPLPGDCGLPPEHPHPRSRFHPLPMHDVLRGQPRHLIPGQAEPIGREEASPEALPAPPSKPLDKSSAEPPPAKEAPAFQTEEEDDTEPAEADDTRANAPPKTFPATRARRDQPSTERSVMRIVRRPWNFVQPSAARRAAMAR